MLLHNYSHYSVLNSVLKPKDIVGIAAKMGHSAAAITDLNTMAGVVQFQEAAEKAGIKPILGLEIQSIDDSTLVLLAKNKLGYESLMKILGLANDPAHFFNHACLPLDKLPGSIDTSNIICLTGHKGSKLYSLIENKSPVDSHIKDLFSYFDRNNVYLQCQTAMPEEISGAIEDISSEYIIDICHTNNLRYNIDEDSKYLYNIAQAKKFKTRVSHLDVPSEIFEPYIDANLDYFVNNEICDKCEEYQITRSPQLPKFSCPDGLSAEQYTRQICREGFRRKVRGKVNDEQIYVDRIQMELSLFDEQNLCDYFLIVRDILQKCTELGGLNGPGRGSAAGSLMAYLMDITKVDPIKYDLSLSRFFNYGRVSGGNSLPDIDFDVPPNMRAPLVTDLEEKYGRDKVGRIATYQTFMGRAALKAVFTGVGDMSFEEINKITSIIEDKSKISDELELMKEQGRDPSVILWALENKSDRLRQWAYLENDEIKGPNADEFRRAIKLEGVKSAQAKHAAGVVITTDPLAEMVPILYDKDTQESIVGLEYEDAEKMGCLKLDLLGLASLSKMQKVQQYTNPANRN